MEQAVPQILKRAAEKAGLKRTRYQDKNAPTLLSNVTVFVSFGDIRSQCMLSSILLRRYREESKGSRYFIMCSWNGCEGMFPWVDEYWSIGHDDNFCKSLYNRTEGMQNKSDIVAGIQRVLNTFFEDVVDAASLDEFYQDGLKQEFFDRYKHIKRYLPSVPSSVILGTEFNRRLNSSPQKVFLYPAMYLQRWHNGKLQPHLVGKRFWIELANFLINRKITPVIYRNFYSYDLSPDLLDTCIHFAGDDMLHVLSAMRASGCVLDMFTGISKLAILARCPYLVCQERAVRNQMKDYEIEDLCGPDVPRRHIYLSPDLCDEVNAEHWSGSLFDFLLTKAQDLIDVNKDALPSPVEVYDIVPYSNVNVGKVKHIGSRYIRLGLDKNKK